jgi:hypothetical protein
VTAGFLLTIVYAIAGLLGYPVKPTPRKNKKEKTARTSMNTGFLAVLAEKEGFEPSRRFPDLLP